MKILSSIRESLLVTLANNLPRIFDRFRYIIWSIAGMNVGGKCTIWGPLTIRPIGGVKNIEIGEGTFMNSNIRFGVPVDKVVIGKNVQIGPGVMFETVNHNLEYIEGIGRSISTQGITVEDEVWIGAGVIITPGVTLKRGAVVAAGAVVTKDVPSKKVFGGVPAREINLAESPK